MALWHPCGDQRCPVAVSGLTGRDREGHPHGESSRVMAATFVNVQPGCWKLQWLLLSAGFSWVSQRGGQWVLGSVQPGHEGGGCSEGSQGLQAQLSLCLAGSWAASSA